MSGIPVVFVSSTDSGVGVMVTVGVNTSSFVTGPFSRDILVTGLNTVLHHACSFSSSIAILRRENTLLGANSGALAVNSRGISLSGGRCEVVLALVRGGNEIMDHRGLVSTL